ncbi:Purple acid phosphatase-like N-terminal [Arabidopsis suecica]|uniref:acid phosphatase n=1 Tax=Arabidopsis suecica TaxID=45249 RepID=A0A8T1YNZ5_ARASU|nr:Purple acid phosphatase-like N-terminal [Arabidopsis suecica]
MTSLIIITLTSMSLLLAAGETIPTTLDGPFKPLTRRFDPSLRRGSDDLPMDHPRLRKRNVSSNFPEQIALALSTPTSMWVSWVTGLEPETKYYYRCGDSSVSAMSEEISFETLPLPSKDAYPHRIAFVGDMGLTSNTTTTIDHLMENDPSLVIIVGDLTYANQYRTIGGKGASCFSCSFPDAPIRETYQPRWDAWGRFMEPLTSKVPTMVIEGNHEIEPQASGITFKSYSERFSVPASESGSNSNFYYSFDAGGVHFVMLGAYVDYNHTGAQYAWLKEDLSKVDRAVTPWLVATMHPPWYNSYSSHYQEFECMRQEMEELLYQHRVDIVFAGHVHAYERMNRIYNYTLDPCGPVYITIGDGGNIEKVDVDFADDPGKCPSPGDNIPEIGGSCPLNFTSGPAKGKFCWDRQPDWSAFRESSFGHGILEVMNLTHALWTWQRNQDVYKNYSSGDQIYIVRQPNVCTPPAISRDVGEGREKSSGDKSRFSSPTLPMFICIFFMFGTCRSIVFCHDI